jgi:hypothetical protein
MEQNKELNELEKDVENFIQNIENHVDNSDFNFAYRILSVDNLCSDSYTYNDEYDIACIKIDSETLVKRWQKILKYESILKPYTSHDILVEMYRHILDHEFYHFKSKNIEAFKIKNSSELLSGNKLEKVKEEEFSAEQYAINGLSCQ